MPNPIMKRSEREIAQSIRRKVEKVRKVNSCREVEVHMTGKKPNVNIRISVDNGLSFEEVHSIVSDIEREVNTIVANSRVTVQTESLSGQEEVWRLVKEVADGIPGSRGVHNIHVQTVNGKLAVDLHLEVSANMTVRDAHEVSDLLEKKLREANPSISEITVHMESASDLISRELIGGGTELKWYVEHVAKSFPQIKGVHGIKIREIRNTVHIVLRCHFDPDITMEQAHEISNKLESTIKSVYPNIDRIDIHEEPD